jgi:perosamine synthetase
MSKTFIPQMEPWFGIEEKIAINNYMNEDGWLTEFKHTQEFEKQIAEFVGAKHCIVVNNGTISLTLIAIAAGIKFGDEVIVPNYTMIATPNSVKMLGADPVFVDVEPDTLCLDFEKMKSAVTNKTKAVIFVNANGRNPKVGIENYINFCKQRNIIFIEDSAQSLGSYYPNGMHQGTLSLAGSLSFSAPKIISTGQGGAIITNNDDINLKLRKLKDFGRSGGGNDMHDSIGFNFKFTEMQAVIGLEQMKKLSWRVNRKKEIFTRYAKNLKSVNEIKFFDQDLTFTTPWFIDVLVEQRDSLQTFLKNNNLGTRVMYPPINKQIAYSVDGEHIISNLVGEKGLWLPSAAQLSDDDIDFITEKIIEFYS